MICAQGGGRPIVGPLVSSWLKPFIGGALTAVCLLLAIGAILYFTSYAGGFPGLGERRGADYELLSPSSKGKGKGKGKMEMRGGGERRGYGTEGGGGAEVKSDGVDPEQ